MIHSSRVSMCREGLYYLFVLAFIVGGATLREKNLLFILAGMMIGPLLFNWRIVVLTLRQFHVSRGTLGYAFAGHPVRIEIVGENRRRHLGSWVVVVEDEIQFESGGTADAEHETTHAKATVVFPFVGARSTCDASYRLTLYRRGKYRLGPLRVYTRFPLGLIKASAVVKSYHHLVVYPRLGRLAPDWMSRLESPRTGHQQAFHRQGPIDGDYYGLREWRPGDSRRWIHWRTSAKIGKLAVKQFEQPQNRDLVLVLDLWEPEAADEDDWTRVELAVSFTATVIDEVCRRGGSRLTLAIAGAENHISTATASSVFADDLMNQLAVVRAGQENGFDAMLAGVVAEAEPGTKVVVIGTRQRSLEEVSASVAFANNARSSRALRDTLWLHAETAKMMEIFQID